MTESDGIEEQLSAHVQELRRGTVVLACLSLLESPTYGYALLSELEGRGVRVDANTLYPLLRRLQFQGLLTCEWNTDEPRPRKYYTRTARGHDLLQGLRREWHELAASMRSIEQEER